MIPSFLCQEIQMEVEKIFIFPTLTASLIEIREMSDLDPPPSLLISSRYLHSRWWTVWADWRRWRPSSRRWCQRLRALSGSLWNTTVRTDWGKANKMNIYLKVAFSSKLLFFNIQMEAKNGTLKNNEYKFSPNTFDGSSLYGFP